MTNKRVRCQICSKLKVREDFVRDRIRASGIFPWCKQCHADKQKEYNKVKIAPTSFGPECLTCGSLMGEAHFNRKFCSAKCKGRFRRWAMFGLSPAEFKLCTKDGKCPLCQKKITKWVIDHNHETGETMGPVCHRCNQYLLAGSGHNIEIAKRLVEFLQNSPVRILLGERRYTGPEMSSQMHRQWLWNQSSKKKAAKSL